MADLNTVMARQRIKPIETHYHGHRFRSRLEARWAVFFDAVSISYEYEPEGFKLPDGSWYLPDFWLPNCSRGVFVEVKHIGGDFTKAITLAEHTGRPVLLAEGAPELRGYEVATGDGRDVLPVCFTDRQGLFWNPGCAEWVAEWNPDTAAAVRAARAARFEHGRRG